MVRLARSDGSYATERAAPDRRAAFGALRLGPADAARVLGPQAEVAEARAQDTVQFTRLIKQSVPYEERTGLVEALWRVAVADGINADERGLMRLVADLLGVADQDSGARPSAGPADGVSRRTGSAQCGLLPSA